MPPAISSTKVAIATSLVARRSEGRAAAVGDVMGLLGRGPDWRWKHGQATPSAPRRQNLDFDPLAGVDEGRLPRRRNPRRSEERLLQRLDRSRAQRVGSVAHLGRPDAAPTNDVKAVSLDQEVLE